MFIDALLMLRISTDYDDLEDSLDGNGNCNKSTSSKSSGVKSCFTGAN